MDGSTAVGKGYRLARFSIYCRRQRLSTGYIRPQHFIQAGACCSTSVESYCHRQWLSLLIDRLQLQSTMAIDRHISLPIVTGNGYRLMHFLIYCDRQWLSIETVYNHVWSAIAIDGHRLQSCGGQWLSIDTITHLFHTCNVL